MLTVQIGVTLLSVAAVLFSAVGVLRLRRGAVSAQRRMDGERALRNEIRDRLRLRQKAAPEGTAGNEDLQMAMVAWRAEHEAADIEPFTWQSVNDGREFLAERIILELARNSRSGTVLVGIGLACGLAASIWGTWVL